MKSNLLDFQHTVLDDGEAIFSIERQTLNPDYDFEETGIKETYNKKDYSNKTLRDFIYDHTGELAANGNFIKGKANKNKVTISIVKIR